MTLPWGVSSRDELKEGMWVLVGDALLAPREKKQIKEIRREVRRDGTPLYGSVSQTMTVTVFFTDGTSAGEDVHIEWTGVAFNDDGWSDAEGKCLKCEASSLAFKAALKEYIKEIELEPGKKIMARLSEWDTFQAIFKCRACGWERRL